MASQLPRISSVKRFYFLEYFYVLLKSVEKYSDSAQAFGEFKTLKQARGLGESKYKIKADESSEPSQRQMVRYQYTFEEVIDEAVEYQLIEEDSSHSLFLTARGEHLLRTYEHGEVRQFNNALFECMEHKYLAPFRYLIELLYKHNDKASGLLVFPSYSPRQLQFERSSVTTTLDIYRYAKALASRLQKDIENHLGVKQDLSEQNEQLLDKLHESQLLPRDRTAKFDAKKYNAIIKRFRDHWITHFLRELYRYQGSLSSFERWLYRGKQIGIIYATDFYPGFTGRIVYPTSVVLPSVESSDFESLYRYPDGEQLFIHRPEWNEKYQERFVKALWNAYLDLRGHNRSYFINLLSIREYVCYNLRISDYLFGTYLEKAYRLNLAGELSSIQISLEVDRLPEETTAIYLKREPVMVDGKYRNIIAIDMKGTRHEPTNKETVSSEPGRV